MLGVLSNIGVLSVGWIYGKSKAKAKYKITKAQEQISMLLINIRTAFSGSSSYKELSNSTAVMLNIVPADMLPSGLEATDVKIVNAFSGAVTISEATNNAQHFTITFAGLGRETCTSLASSDWGTEGLVSMLINDSDYDQSELPIRATVAVKDCDQTDSANSITWEYY